MDNIRLRCASLRVNPSGQVTVVGPRFAGAVGGNGGKPFRARSCPRQGVATGAVIRAGNSVDGFGLRCGEFSAR